MNEYFGHEKFKYIPYPYSNYTVKSFGEYNSLCCWFGSIHGQDHIDAIETIGKYDYKIVVFAVDINDETPFSKTLLQEISNHIGIIVKMLLSECDFIRIYSNGILQCNPSY